MTDLISRQGAIKALCENGMCGDKNCNAFPCEDVKAIMRVPTIDPVKHGKWLNTSTDIPKLLMNVCSECGFQYPSAIRTRFNYCPNCGAKNGGEE